MARETDFLDLYRILDLEPGCDLDAFKHAYRRRVAVLHPDRRSDDSHHVVAVELLQRLTAMYGMAMEFHRTHGRLPGAPQVRSDPQVPASEPDQRARAVTARPARRRSRRWLLLPTTAVAVWLLWPGDRPTTPAPVVAEAARAPARRIVPTPTTERPLLGLGMDAAAVLASEGEPMLKVNDERWEYGPSWIRFEHGKVVDWYSSPMYPLHTTTRSGAHGSD